jgi:hypothetical protein
VARAPGPREEAIVTIPRLIAIVFIYLCTALGWSALGTSVLVRTGEHDGRQVKEVERLWGGAHTQVAPRAWVERRRTALEAVEEKDAAGRTTRLRHVEREVVDEVDAPLVATRADVALDLDQRQRGLLWYDTYGVAFRAIYTFRNPDDEARPVVVRFVFPSANGIYDDFELTLDGVPASSVADLSKGVAVRTTLAGGGVAVLKVAYRSRGLGTWTYQFGQGDVSQVRDFQLAMTTDFDEIDFPAGSVSPTSKARRADGWTLTWRFANLVTGQRVGMDLPNRLNPGPLAARITFFAPVSLLFFLTVLVMLGVTRNENLHPMNYFFLAAAFFAFHLLLAYLVDHVSIQVAFVVAAATSLLLVVSYLGIVTGMRRALLQAGLAQLVFLVLFSYAFFFEGFTGLTVTIGAVVTLFGLMQMTARVDWEAVFRRPGPAPLVAPGQPAQS